MNTNVNANSIATSLKIKVGVFVVGSLLLIAALTFFVNDKPFWWRPCGLVYINIDDATGLKSKSPVRSLGIQIGYLKTVELTETYVRLGICITAPVEVLADTRAYIKGEGFLGDKFVELKPVKYIGSDKTKAVKNSIRQHDFRLVDFLIPSAAAEDKGKEVKVGENSQDMNKLIGELNKLVTHMSALAADIHSTLKPEDMKKTLDNLNKTLEGAAQTLSPKGNLNATATKALIKLEGAFTALKDQMEKINRGEGSLGKLLNDSTYADEIQKALKNLNKLLNRASDLRLVVNVGAEQVNQYNGGRGYFQLSLWPAPDRYYRLGASVDPRGRLRIINTTTTVGTVSTNVQTQEVEEGAFLFTAMLGKVFFKRLDLSVGALYGDATLSTQINLGPTGSEEMLVVRNDIYSRGRGVKVNDRLIVQAHPFAPFNMFQSLYVQGGIESFRQYNGKIVTSFGAGISFDDEDIKLLFALKP